MTNRPNHPWSGRPPGHVGHAHFWERLQSRRRFLEAAGAAGLALSSGLWWPERALAGHKTSPPKPIPGGVLAGAPPGHFIHHIPPGPVDQGHEPSQITDFNGFVGNCRITGTGTGTGFAKPLLFQADMGFMKGVYVGEDGKRHRGTFAFI
jgi:hypothetical protein